ncbi:hypothetical protein RB195_022755 [Necator americanus]|uniref:Reverse transcriptase domain-containing protein n=1 Tax=Necator americanus TaxID=51031 RepID=A0ABR1EJ21_NECAM
MRKLEWDDMGVKIDGGQLHHLRFADDVVLITPSISQAERMLTEFDETCGCIGLQLNLQKTMFMRNGWVSDAPFTLNGTNISECTSYVYLGRELNMMNDLTPELGRRRRAAWGAYKSIEDVVKKTRNTRLRAHLFNTTVLPALTYASETWAFRKQEENAVSVIERAIERVMLGVSRFTQVRDGIRSSLLRQRSKIRDAAAFAKESKIRWAGHVMRFNDNRWTRAVSDWVPRDIKRTTGRPPTRWSDFFTKSLKEKYDALRVPRERRNHWATLARDRDKWKNYWRPLDQFEDQRESRLLTEAKNGKKRRQDIMIREDGQQTGAQQNQHRLPPFANAVLYDGIYCNAPPLAQRPPCDSLKVDSDCPNRQISSFTNDPMLLLARVVVNRKEIQTHKKTNSLDRGLTLAKSIKAGPFPPPSNKSNSLTHQETDDDGEECARNTEAEGVILQITTKIIGNDPLTSRHEVSRKIMELESLRNTKWAENCIHTTPEFSEGMNILSSCDLENQNADRNEAGPHEEVKQVAICSSMDPITRDVERRLYSTVAEKGAQHQRKPDMAGLKDDER